VSTEKIEDFDRRIAAQESAASIAATVARYVLDASSEATAAESPQTLITTCMLLSSLPAKRTPRNSSCSRKMGRERSRAKCL
jgi:hypothetical protein